MPRHTDRSISTDLADLKTFVEVCDHMSSEGVKRSIRVVAGIMGVSPTNIGDCLRRLNEKYSEKLVNITKAVSSFTLTKAGELVLNDARKIFQDYLHLERKIEELNKNANITAKIGASPYLISTIVPAAIRDCVKDLGENARIDCEDAYEVRDFVDKISRGELDFAIVWNYQGRAESVEKTPGLGCAFSERHFDALIAFDMNHEFARRIVDGEPSVRLDELKNHKQYVLPEGHRFLDKEITDTSFMSSVPKVECYSINSMLGNIRAGMPGIAIIPAFYRELDRFRRDGSICFLPLKDKDGKSIRIGLIYIFRSNKQGGKPLSMAEFVDPSGAIEGVQMRGGAKALVRHMERTLLEQPTKSGWQVENRATNRIITDHEGGLVKSTKNINLFGYCYYISTDKIGGSRPQWHFATADLSIIPDTEKQMFSGSLKTNTTGSSKAHYAIDGELFRNRLIVIKGQEDRKPIRSTGADCFVATFNFVDPNGTRLVGVWSGRDGSAESPMAGPIVLSKELLNSENLRELVHIAMVRHLTSVTGSFSAMLDNIFDSLKKS